MSENFCLLLTSCDKGTSQTEARGTFLPHHPLLPLPRPTRQVPDSAASWPHSHRRAMGTGGAAGMGALLLCSSGASSGIFCEGEVPESQCRTRSGERQAQPSIPGGRDPWQFLWAVSPPTLSQAHAPAPRSPGPAGSHSASITATKRKPLLSTYCAQGGVSGLGLSPGF